MDKRGECSERAGPERGAFDRLAGLASRKIIWVLLAATVLYVGSYVAASRAAPTVQVPTYEGPRLVFAFLAVEDKKLGMRWPELPGGGARWERVLYYVYYPLIRLDAYYDMRYHAMRCHLVHNGKYEVW